MIQSTRMLANQQVEKQFERDIGEHRLLVEKVCRIYAFSKTDRQDLFQEIVIQAWKAYERFKGESAFSTYLYRIALNTAIKGLRKKKTGAFIQTVEPASLPHYIEENESDLAEEQLRSLYESIGLLNEVEKALVFLYLEDKSYKEMETIMGMNEGALRVKMSRIKDKLRAMNKM